MPAPFLRVRVFYFVNVSAYFPFFFFVAVSFFALTFVIATFHLCLFLSFLIAFKTVSAFCGCSCSFGRAFLLPGLLACFRGFLLCLCVHPYGIAVAPFLFSSLFCVCVSPCFSALQHTRCHPSPLLLAHVSLPDSHPPLSVAALSSRTASVQRTKTPSCFAVRHGHTRFPLAVV